jgi:hypothetical protein
MIALMLFAPEECYVDEVHALQEFCGTRQVLLIDKHHVRDHMRASNTPAQQPSNCALPAQFIYTITASRSIARIPPCTPQCTMKLSVVSAPEECCLDEVDALLWHQARDDSNHRLVRALVKTQALAAAAAAATRVKWLPSKQQPSTTPQHNDVAALSH